MAINFNARKFYELSNVSYLTLAKWSPNKIIYSREVGNSLKRKSTERERERKRTFNLCRWIFKSNDQPYKIRLLTKSF